jgi:uncharacterized protein YqkB
VKSGSEEETEIEHDKCERSGIVQQRVVYGKNGETASRCFID